VAAARSRRFAMPGHGGSGRHRWAAGAAGHPGEGHLGGWAAPEAGDQFSDVAGGLQERPDVVGAGEDNQGPWVRAEHGVQAEWEKIQAEPAKRSPAAVSAGRALRLAPRPPFLVGWEELLAGLDARLADGDGREPRVVVLSGLGHFHAGALQAWVPAYHSIIRPAAAWLP
jgi:hypothetical protein